MVNFLVPALGLNVDRFMINCRSFLIHKRKVRTKIYADFCVLMLLSLASDSYIMPQAPL